MARLDAREREIARLRTVDGLTLQQIGDRHGISRERVRQLLNHYYFHLGQSLATSHVLRTHPTAIGVITRLRVEGPKRDIRAKRRATQLAHTQQTPLSASQRSRIFRDAPIAVSDEIATLLYILARTRGGHIIELGGSLGISTIHLAAGIKDSSRHGTVLTTELDPVKAQALTTNLHRADLHDTAEVRAGDAQDTLTDLDGPPVDLLFLDGWNEHYLPVLQLLENHLAPDALVLATLSPENTDLRPYLNHVRDNTSPWLSTTLPLDAGVEMSLRAR
jgi:predicted O-methyltransferase YrrM